MFQNYREHMERIHFFQVVQPLSNLEWVARADKETAAVFVIVDDPRVHCIGEGAADTVVECQHNSSGQALLQRTQLQEIIKHVKYAYFNDSS